MNFISLRVCIMISVLINDNNQIYCSILNFLMSVWLSGCVLAVDRLKAIIIIIIFLNLFSYYGLGANNNIIIIRGFWKGEQKTKLAFSCDQLTQSPISSSVHVFCGKLLQETTENLNHTAHGMKFKLNILWTRVDCIVLST